MKQNLERNKGFTLIELLAVIVILAIIALIAVPVVMNIINKANKSAFKDSAYGLIKAGELFYTSELLENAGLYEDKTFTFPNDIEGLEIKGSKPTGGYVTINKEGQISMAVTNGKYCVTKDFEDNDVTISDGNCELVDNTGDILDNTWPIEWNTMKVLENTSSNYTGINFIRVSNLTPSAAELAHTQILANLDGKNYTFAYLGGETINGSEGAMYEESSTGMQIAVASVPSAINYDGLLMPAGLYVMNMGHEDNGSINADVVFEILSIGDAIYYNPNKDKLCTKYEWTNNVDKNGKSGCMRWYIYGEENNKQKLILDHNTTNQVAWISADDYVDNDNCSYDACNDQGSKTLDEQLKKDTKEWKIEADIITWEEVVQLLPYYQNLSDNDKQAFLNPKEDTVVLKAYESEILTAVTNLENMCNQNSILEICEDSFEGAKAKMDYLKENYVELFLPNYMSEALCKNNILNAGENTYECDTYGYWMKTVPSNNYKAWLIGYQGLLDSRMVSDVKSGLRPVIKISK